jgi:hypothetical protein
MGVERIDAGQLDPATQDLLIGELTGLEEQWWMSSTRQS